jgi:hypothetical protein
LKSDKQNKKKQYLMNQGSQQALPIANSFVLGGATNKMRAQGNNSTLFGGGSTQEQLQKGVNLKEAANQNTSDLGNSDGRIKRDMLIS